MKIAHLTTVHATYDIRILYKECVTLARSGYDVVLFVPAEADERVDGVCISALPKFGSRIGRFLRGGLYAYRAAMKSGAPICHLHDPELLIVGQLLRLRGRVVVFDMHENVPRSINDKTWIPKWCRGLVRFIYKCLERILMNGMQIIYAENSYAKYYPYVRSGVTLLNYPFSSLAGSPVRHASEDLSIGYLGGVTPNRGMNVIMDALEIIDETGTGVTWHCVGSMSDDYRGELARRAEQFTHVKVIFYGRLKPVDGWKIMARCRLGLAVLLPIENYMESYPTKMFEYMAMGLPTIVSNFPIYKEIVLKERCGLCVDPSCPDQVADAIMNILNDSSGSREMGELGRQAILNRYNWEHESEKLVSMYENISRNA